MLTDTEIRDRIHRSTRGSVVRGCAESAMDLVRMMETEDEQE